MHPLIHFFLSSIWAVVPEGSRQLDVMITVNVSPLLCRFISHLKIWKVRIAQILWIVLKQFSFISFSLFKMPGVVENVQYFCLIQYYTSPYSANYLSAKNICVYSSVISASVTNYSKIQLYRFIIYIVQNLKFYISSTIISIQGTNESSVSVLPLN